MIDIVLLMYCIKCMAQHLAAVGRGTLTVTRGDLALIM